MKRLAMHLDQNIAYLYGSTIEVNSFSHSHQNSRSSLACTSFTSVEFTLQWVQIYSWVLWNYYRRALSWELGIKLHRDRFTMILLKIENCDANKTLFSLPPLHICLRPVTSQLFIMIESCFCHCRDIVFACSYCSAVNTPAVYFGEYLLEEGYVK